MHSKLGIGSHGTNVAPPGVIIELSVLKGKESPVLSG